MSAIDRAFNLSYPYEVVLKYIELYKMVGESEIDISELSPHYSVYHEIVRKEDIESLFTMYFKNPKVTSSRMSNIIDSTQNLQMRNIDETYLNNLVRIFNMIYSSSKFELSVNEIIDLESQLSTNINKSKGLKRANKGEISYRERLESIINAYHLGLKSGKTEVQYLNTSFLVDFIKLSPFYDNNELIGIIIFYVLLINTDITSFAYSSFFKKLKAKEEDYKKFLNISFYMYDEGMTNISELFKFFLEIEIESYKDLRTLRRGMEQDKVLKKSSGVETVIYKLPSTFKKEDIRRLMPTVSDSTIDRVLSQMQEEGKITSIGRGRSAAWVRLDNSYEEKKVFFDNFDN